MARFFSPASGFTLSVIALTALAACSTSAPRPAVAPAPPPMAAAPPPPPAPPPAAPAPAPTASSDQEFIDQAATSGIAEVAGGQAARTGAKSRAVRAFGARMVADHTRANNRLMALARRLKMPVTPAGEPPAPAPGPEFDRQYIGEQVSAHQQAIALFESEAQSGQNPQLKRFAAQSLPMLRHHLQMAEGIARRMAM